MQCFTNLRYKGRATSVGEAVDVTCTEHNHPPDHASNKAEKLQGVLHEEGLSDFLDVRLSTFACLFLFLHKRLSWSCGKLIL